jgi:hypothetical protein
MELDDFKNIFREKTQSNSSKSKEEIETLLHKKSTSALEKIMRNMVVEIAISFLVCIVLAIALISIKPSGIPLLLAVLTMAAVFIQLAFFYPSFQKFRQLHKSGSENLIIWLNELIETLENFIKAYHRYIAWGMPLGGLVGGTIGYMESDKDLPIPTLSLDFIQSKFLYIAIVLAIAIIMFRITYWFAYYTVKKLYSRYLDALKASKEELMKEN